MVLFECVLFLVNDSLPVSFGVLFVLFSPKCAVIFSTEYLLFHLCVIIPNGEVAQYERQHNWRKAIRMKPPQSAHHLCTLICEPVLPERDIVISAAIAGTCNNKWWFWWRFIKQRALYR